jgi:pimeloyl-ACP methyl ester carboxylesterase
MIAAALFFKDRVAVSPENSSGKPDGVPLSSMETVSLITKDNKKIIGDYHQGEKPAGVLLLPMMPAVRKSWRSLAEKLGRVGFHTLAIDLRGHGESEGGPDGYRSFSDADHQSSRLDVEAAVDFLKEKGIEELHLAGASIGANLALEYLANHREAKSAVLLSPGLDYRGITTEPMARRIGSEQGVLIAASDEDMRSTGTSAIDMARVIFSRFPHSYNKKMREFSGKGHGTMILEREPAFMDEIVAWMTDHSSLFNPR